VFFSVSLTFVSSKSLGGSLASSRQALLSNQDPQIVSLPLPPVALSNAADVVGKKKGGKKKKKKCGKKCKKKKKAAKAAALAATTTPPPAPTTTPAPLTAEPTLAPWRFNNYNPVPSDAEEELDKNGPTVPPERDCIRTAGRSGCSCLEIIDAAAEETNVCDMKVQALEMNVPGVARNNYLEKIDQPFFNTFLQVREWVANYKSMKKRRSFLEAIRQPLASDAHATQACQVCFLRIAEQFPHPKDTDDPPPNTDGTVTAEKVGVDDNQYEQGDAGAEPVSWGEGQDAGIYQNFIQFGHQGHVAGGQRQAPPGASDLEPDGQPVLGVTVKNEPEEFGWRIFDESPDWGASLAGECTQQEIKDLQAAMAYFWSCDINRKRLDKWIRATNMESAWIEHNPQRRIGFA